MNKSFVLLVMDAVAVLIPMVLSLTVHEFAHAWTAKQLGDDTAQRLGRLNLNPLAHADWLGTLVLPLSTLVLAGSGVGIPFFGWAKPVPVDASRFRRTISVRWGSALVAAAGPAANFILAMLATLLLGWASRQRFGLGEAGALLPWVQLLHMLVMINIALGLFNLLPLYPLDGEKIVAGFLATSQAMQFERFNQRYGTYVLWAVVLFGRDIIGIPVALLSQALLHTVGL